MGALLAVFLVLLLVGRLRKFAVAVALAAIGFALTLNLLNVDAFLVKRNAARLAAADKVDVHYLASLSEDALPGLLYLAHDTSGQVRENLLGELACWSMQLDRQMENQSWPSTHISRLTARERFHDLQEAFEAYEVYQNDWGAWLIHGEGEDALCAHQSWWR